MNLAIARRKVTETAILTVRALTPADLAFVRSGPAHVDSIKRMRDRHHHIAWLIAMGKSHGDISVECHISVARINQYLKDPTFNELVSKRREELNQSRREAGDAFITKATETMTLAEDELQGRIRDDPSSVHIRDLNRISADRMDRFGYGKHTTSDNRTVNINFASKLEAAVARSRKAG